MIQEYTVTGMHCAACSASVERVVRKIDGVQAASVSLLSERLYVRCDTDLTDKILSAVIRAGFSAQKAPDAIDSRREGILRRERERKNMKRRLIAAIIFAVPLFYIAMAHMAGLPSYPAPDKPFIFAIVQLLLVIPIMIAGSHFYKRGIPALFSMRPNMDSLIAVSTVASFAFSLFSLINIARGHLDYVHHLYFDSVGMIITLVMLGKYFEARAKKNTSAAIDDLISMLPEKACVIKPDGEQVYINSSELLPEEQIRVRPGESFPADGVILSGETCADESMLTGESMPCEKSTGDYVTAGTVNMNGVVDIKTVQVGSGTKLAAMIRMVDEAQSSSAPIARLADKVCGIFVPVVMSIALISGIVWFFITHDVAVAVRIFTSVLVIACPCALGLATPTAIMVATDRSATHGILIRSGAALEQMHKINVICLDKTGTLTTGKPEVTDVIPINSDDDTLLELFSSLEAGSEHPLGKCICEYAREKGISPRPFSDFQAVGGRGASAVIDGVRVYAGNAAFMSENGFCDIPDVSKLQNEGKTVMFIAHDRKIEGAVAVTDALRKESADVIAELKDMGIEPVLISGDNSAVAGAVAEKLGIEKYRAEVLPADKAEIVENLRAEGKTVAMLGDGINDAVAIAVADVGMAVRSGTDIACSAADVVLTSDSISLVTDALHISARTMRIIKQNLFWAFAYNCIGIPIAAGVLSPIGIELSPTVGALAMCLSSVTVVTNALRLGKGSTNKRV